MIKKAIYEQDIFDACIWAYGSIADIGKFVAENGLKFDSRLSQGQKLTYDNTAGNKDVKDYLTRANVIPKSSGGNIIDNWILATGFWNDSGEWIDTSNWID